MKGRDSRKQVINEIVLSEQAGILAFTIEPAPDYFCSTEESQSFVLSLMEAIWNEDPNRRIYLEEDFATYANLVAYENVVEGKVIVDPTGTCIYQ